MPPMIRGSRPPMRCAAIPRAAFRLSSGFVPWRASPRLRSLLVAVKIVPGIARASSFDLRVSTRPLSACLASLATPDAATARPPPHFSDFPLEKAAHLRTQPAALEQLLNDPKARAVAYWDRKALVAETAAQQAGTAACPPPHEEKSAFSSETPPLAPQAFTLAPEGAEAPDGCPPVYVLLAWHPQSPALVAAMDTGLGFIFLGLSGDGSGVFACRLWELPDGVHIAGDLTAGDENGELSSSTSSGTFPAAAIDVRSKAQRMTGPDAAVLALTAGLMQWHAGAAFCSRTGLPTAAVAAGHSRRAVPPKESSNLELPPRAFYPRVDPAVIVGVSCGEWFLLGRKSTWEAGRYSLLAGFTEIGESLEGAVVREVEEESGVKIDPSTIQYHASQPWPYPQSLMVGFVAKTAAAGKNESSSAGGLQGLPRAARAAAMDVGVRGEEADAYSVHALPAVVVDKNELEDARWFHAAWLRAALSPTSSSSGQPEFRIPGKYALANRIINDWLDGALDPGSKSSSSSESWTGDALPDVAIDEGVFKYVLLRVSSPDGSCSKLIVRGACAAAYHAHIVTHCKGEAARIDPFLRIDVAGGGRMEAYAQNKTVFVYGYSAGFGQAPHHVTAGVLRRWDPFLEVEVSYDGY